MSDQPDPTPTSRISRRRFLASAAGGALLPAVAGAQAPKVDAATLRRLVDAAELAISDEQLGKMRAR